MDRHGYKSHEGRSDTPELSEFTLLFSNDYAEEKKTLRGDNEKKSSRKKEVETKAMSKKDIKCLGLTRLFVGYGNETSANRDLRIEEAKAVCSTCVLIEPCRNIAYERAEVGVRGGESETDRYLNGAPIDTTSPEIVNYQRSIGKRAS